MKFSSENFIRIYDDENGCYWQIGHDADGCNCVEIRYSDNHKDSKVESLVVLPPPAARLIAAAILKIADSVEAQEIADRKKI